MTRAQADTDKARRVRRIILWTAVAAVIALTIRSCWWPTPRIEVALEDVSVVSVDRRELFGPHGRWDDPVTPAIRIDFSSGEDLGAYFLDRGLMVMPECFVMGAEDGRSYYGVTGGPFTGSVDISMWSDSDAGKAPERDDSGRFRYTMFSFLELRARDQEYVNGRPRGELDLTAARFSHVDCFVRGTTKAPMLFPRTMSMEIAADEIKAEIAKLSDHAER